jgi:hypothetical protein
MHDHAIHSDGNCDFGGKVRHSIKKLLERVENDSAEIKRIVSSI